MAKEVKRFKPKTPQQKAKIKKALELKAKAAEKRRKMIEAVKPLPVVLTDMLAEEDARTGRPTVFKKEYITKAKEMCEQGATMSQLADEFGVSTITIWRWRSKFPEFCSAVGVGTTTADNAVTRSLYERAVGFTADVPALKKVPLEIDGVIQVKNGAVVMIEKEVFVRTYFPPDVFAQKLWLGCRQPEKWSEKVKHEQSGTVKVEHTKKDEEDLIERMVQKHAGIQRRLLGEGRKLDS